MTKEKEVLGEWVLVNEHGFVRQLEENIFEVVRINDADAYVHVEFYDKVNIKKVRKKDFKHYGDLNEYLQKKTLLEKAMYLAVFGRVYDTSITCLYSKEITDILIAEGVIRENQKYEEFLNRSEQKKMQ